MARMRRDGAVDDTRARRTRLLRFAATGGLAALVQLGLLAVLTGGRRAPLPAEGVALLASTQVNFVLSYLYTWRDRRLPAGTPRALLRRWLAYQGTVAATALLNVGIFMVARAGLPVLAASALGTAVAAALNFVAGDRLVFRVRDRGATERPLGVSGRNRDGPARGIAMR